MVEDSLYSLLSQVTLVIAKFLVAVIIARSGGPELQGLYALSLLTITVLSAWTSPGLDIANAFLVASTSDKGCNQHAVASYLSSSLVIVLLCSSITAAAILLLGSAATPLIGISPALLRLIALGLPVYGMARAVRGIVIGMKQFRDEFLAQLGRYLPLPLLVLAASIAGCLNISFILLSWLVCTLIQLLILWLSLDKPNPARFESKAVRRQIRFGRWRFLQTMITFLYTRLDLLAVNHFLGIEQAGFYAIALFIADSFHYLPRIFQAPLTVHVAIHGSQHRLTEYVYRFTLIIGGCFVIFMLLTANKVVPLVFGQAFRGSVPPLLILVSAGVLQAVAALTSHQLYGMGDSFSVFVSTAAGVCTIGVLALPLLPAFGLTGAAMASLLGTVVTMGMLLKSLSRHTERSLSFLLSRWLPRPRDLTVFVGIAGRVLRGGSGGASRTL